MIAKATLEIVNGDVHNYKEVCATANNQKEIEKIFDRCMQYELCEPVKEDDFWREKDWTRIVKLEMIDFHPTVQIHGKGKIYIGDVRLSDLASITLSDIGSKGK